MDTSKRIELERISDEEFSGWLQATTLLEKLISESRFGQDIKKTLYQVANAQLSHSQAQVDKMLPEIKKQVAKEIAEALLQEGIYLPLDIQEKYGLHLGEVNDEL